MTRNAETSGKSSRSKGKQAAKPASTASASNNGTHAAKELRTGANIEDLGKRLGEIQGVNEDMATFLAHNWQRFLGGLVVVLLAAVMVHQYRNTQESRLTDASQRFDSVTSQFSSFLSADPSKAADETAKKALESQREALFEQLKLLRSTQNDSVYGKLASLYSAQANVVQKNYPAAESDLQKFNTAKFSKVTAAMTTEQAKASDMLDELAALQLARLQISDGKIPLAESRKIFSGLALSGRFVNLEAILALFRTSQTPEERAEAVRITNELLTARPELKETVTSQLNSLGIGLDSSV